MKKKNYQRSLSFFFSLIVVFYLLSACYHFSPKEEDLQCIPTTNNPHTMRGIYTAPKTPQAEY